MNVRKYFEARLNGRKWNLSEYQEDNREFFKANIGLTDKITWELEGFPDEVIGFGSGEGFYEKQLAKAIDFPFRLFDKRYGFCLTLTPKLIKSAFRKAENKLFVLANFVHVLNQPIEFLEALPKNSQVVIIDTFMAKPNSDWQLFFNNYMYQINKTRLPKMAQYKSLPGWKLIAQHQNQKYLELGYVIIRKVI